MRIKVDEGEPNSSCLCRITELDISLWSALSGPRCSWDCCSEVWNLIPFGGMLQFSGPALQWKWANCLNPLINLVSMQLSVEASGERKRPHLPPPPPPLIWSGRSYSPPQPANTHALAWLSPRLCNIHADTYLDMKRACRANLLPRTAAKTTRALLSTSNTTSAERADKNELQQEKDREVPASHVRTACAKPPATGSHATELLQPSDI